MVQTQFKLSIKAKLTDIKCIHNDARVFNKKVTYIIIKNFRLHQVHHGLDIFFL